MERRHTPCVNAGGLAALQDIEHQAQHWDTPDHGVIGHFIAQALRAAVDIARGGGLECEHRTRSRTPQQTAGGALPDRGVAILSAAKPTDMVGRLLNRRSAAPVRRTAEQADLDAILVGDFSPLRRPG
jgi:hypothetical protein